MQSTINLIYNTVKTKRKRERFETILEPLQAILQIGYLSFAPIGTKLTIQNNILKIQIPNYSQSVVRWYNNDTQEDLFYLFNIFNRFKKFYHFLNEPTVELVAVEAAGYGVYSGMSAATTQLGSTGILHGSKSIVMQTSDGQVVEPHSISAGLDYPGIGPLHAFLYESKRGTFLSATDEEALASAFHISQIEGIIPALETAHAFSVLPKLGLKPTDVVVVCLSGRGDKDLATYMEHL